MKPLHVLDMSRPHVAGYTSRAHSILLSQRDIGYEPVALTSVRQTDHPSGCDEIDGIRYYRTSPHPLLRHAASVPVARELAEMAALHRRILDVSRTAERIDLVHAHSPVLCGIPARAAAKRLDVPFVYEIRAFWEDAAVNHGKGTEGSPRYAAIRALETNLTSGADAVVVICEGIRRDLLARGLDPSRVFTVPNGVDAGRFEPLPRDEALAAELGMQGKTVVAFIGTFFAFEGVNLLLEALDRLTRERDDVRGLIVGYGESDAAIREQHARLGLGNRVVLTGKVPPSEVHRYYSVADVLCYPRERHRITELTTPLKPLEAMAMEKAVLGSDVGGIRELVRDRETGLTFRAGDAEDLVRAARQLIDDPELRRRLGETARREMLEERDWRTLARRYRDAYAAAAEHRAQRVASAQPAPKAA
jgi:PEP-CTERM/exosortase A-associated glycosyltransferase